MIPLDKDLQKAKKNIDEFGDVALRVLQYLPNVLSSSEERTGRNLLFGPTAKCHQKAVFQLYEKIFRINNN